MSTYLYSHDTTPANAAQISADRGEIVHVDCGTAAVRRQYAADLARLLVGYDEFGGGNSEIEVVGTLGGEEVRVHLSIGRES